jgi:hypothetical protein
VSDPSDASKVDSSLSPFQKKLKEWLEKDLSATETELERIGREKAWPSGIPIPDFGQLDTEKARLRQLIAKMKEQLEKLK